MQSKNKTLRDLCVKISHRFHRFTQMIMLEKSAQSAKLA